MYWYYEYTFDAYQDLWVPDIGDIRWRRHLDVATGVHEYQRMNATTKEESAWDTPATLGVPAQLAAANAPTRLAISNSEEALQAYQCLRELTGALAARLLDIRNTIQALQHAADDRHQNVNYLLVKDAESYQAAENANNDADRTRLIRLGVKLVLDPHSSVFAWAQANGNALGARQQPLLAVAGRGNDLGQRLLSALHQ